MAGFLGIALGIFVYLAIICNIKSFGVSYVAPFSSKENGFLLPPIWKREFRASYVAPKENREQAKIAMKWKFNSNSNTK